MKKIIIGLVFILFQFDSIYGQLSIETRLCYSDTTRFNFTGEWQYLSTDIYLFNGNKFSKVINELTAPKGKKSKKGLAEEKLEYLYITAQLINMRFFGDNNIIYPLYNFRINQDRDQKYQTFVSDNIESIRIIDNLPLYSASDKIDAKIDVNAITQNDRDNILGIIGAQLRNLASALMPSNAIFSLMGEMGNFIESNAKKKEYKFSSTIRLFEQKNFDTRLHSLRIYALVAPNSPPIRINDDKLKKYLDTSTMPDISRELLEKLVGYPHYPLIVVANYKSLYRMMGISGDEVSFASIDKRKVDIENNYRNKLISEETYRQERDFIEFLTVFANFKAQLELYTLNARMANVEATMNALGTTMQHYFSLLQSYDRIKYKYRRNKTFATIFQNEYTAILDFAGFYLENDHNLRAAKAMVVAMNELNVNGLPDEGQSLETYLRNLRFADNMSTDFRAKTKEGQSIMKLVNDLENKIYVSAFDKDVATLSTIAANSEKNEVLQRVKERIGTTHCLSCREKASESVKKYNARYEEYLRNNMLMKHDSIVSHFRSELYNFQSDYNTLLTEVSKIDTVAFKDVDLFKQQCNEFNRTLSELSKNIEDLSNYIHTDVKTQSIDSINTIQDKMYVCKSQINDNFSTLNAKLLPTLLNTYSGLIKQQQSLKNAPIVIIPEISTDTIINNISIIMED